MRIYTKNMKVRNKRVRALARNIRRSGADVVMLQEVNGDNADILGMLEAAFPYQKHRSFTGIGGVAVLSKYESSDEAAAKGMVALKVSVEGEMVWVISLHLETPAQSLREHRRQTGVAAKAIADLDGEKVVAGDLNTVFGSNAIEALMNTGLCYVGKRRRTYKHWLLGWFSLDHVLATRTGTNRRLGFFGSDHKGVFANVRFN